MPTTSGALSTANRTVGVKLDMDDAIQILTPSDVPLQQWVGSEPTNSIKVEWLEEDLTPQSDTATVVTGTGPWTVTVADGGIFRVDDVLHVRDAAPGVQFTVTAIATNDLTLAAFAGNATAPAVNNVLVIIGQYKAEGGDPPTARSIEDTAKYNYTQIGQEKVQSTRTQRKRDMYGVDDPYDHELMKKFKEVAIRFERSMVNGQRAISGDNTKRFMGGLLYYITTNTSSGTKANAASLMNALIRKCYDAGGTPRTLMVSTAVKEAISQNVDVSGRRTTRTETTGGSVIDRFASDFGEVEIVANRFFPMTKGLVLQQEFITRKVFDPYFHETLAKTGDAEQGEVVGEFSLRVKNEKAHGVLTITDAT